jgi:serine/threonine-protein kinase
MGEVGGVWWYAMELVDGGLAPGPAEDGALSEREALRLFIPLVEALQHAFERGVVHRDIKPGNILVEKGGRARLVDLGLAVADDDPLLTKGGGTLGTPHYISPEQARDPRSADVQSDLWSFGATLYHAVCGRPPFEASPWPRSCPPCSTRGSRTRSSTRRTSRAASRSSCASA